jgi:serine/threonine protein kinase
MDACAVPEEFAALEPAFAAGVAGVRRKAAAATEIEAAERACAGLRQSFSGEPTIAGFEFLGPISSGAFARVYLARRRATGDPFAVKVIRKANIGLKNQMNSVRAERDIMRRLASPFVVTFFYSFVGMNNLYMVMEYVPGGDLFSLLQNCGSLRENDARIYAAQIVAALRFLREHKVVHRDLKPDNCLVTADGHLKLADFGLSFFGATGGNGRVGTPDYMAPEMVLSKPHGFEVDYWALGAMLFEMLAGVTPFHADDPPSTFCNILSGEIDWALLEDVSPPVFDLLRGLLTFDPRERLGAGSVREIMEHNWFAGIDWDNVHALPPVFVPECSPESHRVYFVDRRYEFADSDEADIREDLAAEIPGSPGGDGFAAVALESLADVNMAIAAQIMRRPRAASERLSQPRDP